MPAWLLERRWFGGKGAEIEAVRAIDRAQVSPGLLVFTLEVTYRGGRPLERYLAPLRSSDGGRPEEALDDDDAARALLEIMRGKRRFPTAAGEVIGERFDTSGSPMELLSQEPSVRRLSAEQSNTSLVFDDRVIVKLIRKLEPGVNPELEMGAFLARKNYRATPQLLGAVSLSGALDATIAVAHRFIKVESDGWTHVLSSLRRDSPVLADEVHQLGLCVGELHATLASDSTDQGFAPEPILREDLQRWANSLLADLDKTLAASVSAVPELAARRPALEARINRLLTIAPSGVRIRQHGDLHLGQVLRSEGQWLLFDFEGEPARPIHQRREKHSPLKDVAGMLRSFAYAAGTVELSDERLQPIRAAFLEGWRSAAGFLLHEDPAAAAVLLDSLELEKLLYELRYEVGHRPAWVRIPARDLLRDRVQ